MTGPLLLDLFSVFAPEDWDSFHSDLEDLSLRYAGIRGPAALVLCCMEIEVLARELAAHRLERQTAELLALTIAS